MIVLAVVNYDKLEKKYLMLSLSSSKNTISDFKQKHTFFGKEIKIYTKKKKKPKFEYNCKI